MLICGRKSFSNEDEDKNGSYKSPHSTSKRSKKSKRFIGKDCSKRNPYAERGLDKFYALLADLDDKKQKIYNQIGAEDVSFVRFVYSESSEHVRPIVVRVKNKKSELKLPPNSALTSSREATAEEEAWDEEKGTSEEKKEEEMMMMNGSFYYCFAVISMVVLVLFFLAIFGRSFAILCTMITWYWVPAAWDFWRTKAFIGR